MTPTQVHLFKLLTEIDDICKKYDIEFFLDYGTALGAVRHEGFIPWDNDLDISMTEDNYNKFRIACQEELDGESRVFIDNRLNREFPMVFGHYIDKTSARMSRFTNYWDYDSGQWIDVFCLIELPPDSKEKRDFINRYYAYDEVVNRAFRHSRWKTPEMMKYYHQFMNMCDEMGRNDALTAIEKELFGNKYEGCEDLMVTSARGLSPTPFVPKSAFNHSRRVMFEGREFKVAADYVEILTLYYGDDFDLIPKDKKTHQEMSHTGISTNVYIDDFMRLYSSKEKYLKEKEEYKELCMEEGARASDYFSTFCKAQGIRVHEIIQKRISKDNINVKSIINSRDQNGLELLDEVFDEYFNKQFDNSTMNWRVCYPLDDELTYAAMMVLLYVRNDLKTIDKLLFLRNQNNIPPSDSMLKLKDIITHLRNIKKMMLYAEYVDAWKNIEWCSNNIPETRLLRTWIVRYKAETARTESEIAEAMLTAQLLLDEYPSDVYARKAIADMKWKSGKKEEAIKDYNEIEEITNDGFMILDICKKKEAFK